MDFFGLLSTAASIGQGILGLVNEFVVKPQVEGALATQQAYSRYALQRKARIEKKAQEFQQQIAELTRVAQNPPSSVDWTKVGVYVVIGFGVGLLAGFVIRKVM